MDTISIIKKLSKTSQANCDELLYLISNLKESEEEFLYESAYEIRKKTYGNDVFVRGLIEFSNYCTQTCNYCGLRAGNKIDRYRLSEDQIINQCIQGYKFGYRTFVLQSGEDPWYTKDKLINIIKSVKSSCPDAALTLSIGERALEEYQEFFEAGADRYLLRQEAADKKLYDSLHPGMSHENRISCLEKIRQIGYQTGGGFMVGIKNQTNEHIVKDLLFLKKLNPHMVGIGPFLPAQNTPFENEKPGTVRQVLIVLALVRLLLPSVLLPLTTALVSLDPGIRKKALMAGANVIMPNITPERGGYHYKLYDQKKFVEGLDQKQMKKLSETMESIGFTLNMGRGDYISPSVP
jgi:biotin synthase